MLCLQDEENIVPSWELRVEGRLLEEVSYFITSQEKQQLKNVLQQEDRC